MNPIVRWLKFNCVGALGVAVQLAAVALIHHVIPRHPLYALAAAVELTLLHNFFWHVHYTWRDRRATSRFNQAVRFHLTNGAVSLAGNLLLVSWLILHTRLPLLTANAIAIVCCSIANFYLAHRWAFTSASAPPARARGTLPDAPAALPHFQRTPTA